MSDYTGPENYILYEISEVLKLSPSKALENQNVRIIGNYKFCEGDHFLCTFIEYKGQSVEEITVDMSLVNKYPVNESTIELYGNLSKTITPVITHFWSNLGYDEDDIRSYLKCLRTQRKYINVNLLYNQ